MIVWLYYNVPYINMANGKPEYQIKW
jgi:hypothetical protein